MSGSKDGGALCPPYALLSGSLWGSSTWYLSLLKGVRVAGHILFQAEGLLHVPFRDGRSRGNDPNKGSSWQRDRGSTGLDSLTSTRVLLFKMSSRPSTTSMKSEGHFICRSEEGTRLENSQIITESVTGSQHLQRAFKQEG